MKQKQINQKQVWNNIAEEWHKFKTSPSSYAQEFLKSKKGKVLDLGSGSGRNLLGLQTKAKIYLCDFSEEMLKLAKQRAKKENIKTEFVLMKNEKLPFKDNFFDAAICVAFLHCIETKEQREKIVKELFRVLKPKAQVEIEVWNKNSKRFKNSPKQRYVSWRDKGKRFYYLYNEKEIHELFKKIGFRIKKKLEHKVNIAFIAEKSN